MSGIGALVAGPRQQADFPQPVRGQVQHAVSYQMVPDSLSTE
ncbi:hypothetical protein [Streptomyces sp. NPDC058247]